MLFFAREVSINDIFEIFALHMEINHFFRCKILYILLKAEPYLFSKIIIECFCFSFIFTMMNNFTGSKFSEISIKGEKYRYLKENRKLYSSNTQCFGLSEMNINMVCSI